MCTGAALADLTVFQWHPAKSHKQLAVRGDGFPTGRSVKKAAERAQNMGHHNFGSCKGIGVFRTRAAADAVQKTFQLALRMVESSGTGPAIGTGVNRLIAKILTDPVQFICDQFVGYFPSHRNEVFFATFFSCCAGPAL